jgi:hypothetical protein
MQENLLKRITQHLIIYAAYIDNVGLMNGKMGIALFFYQLNKVTKNDNHLMYANELMQEIISKLDYKIPRTFFDGMIGIAWGVEYLMRNNFVDFEEEDMLMELDKALLEVNIASLLDESFSTGVRGIAYYLVSRCSGKESIPAPFCLEYIHVLSERISRIEQKDPTAIYLLNQLQKIQSGNIIAYDLNLFYHLIGNEPFDNINLFVPNRNIGILNNGYTGIALRILKNMELKICKEL